MKKFEIKKIELVIFAVLFFTYAYFHHLQLSANTTSRLNLVMAVVDRGVLNIDAYHTNTIDKAYFAGHYYSDKAIGTSLFGIPLYWTAKTLYRLLRLPLTYFEADYWVRLGVISLPSALFAVLFYRFLGFFTTDESRLWLTFAYNLGTLAFPYSTLFFGHQLGAIFAFAAFFFLFKVRHQTLGNGWIFAAGVLAGLAFITEYPTAIIGLFAFIYLSWFLKHRRKIFYFILGFIPPLIPLLLYNYAIFGNPLTLAYSHLAPSNFQASMSQGLMGISKFSWQALWGITFSSYRGLFYYSPFLILFIIGFILLFQRKELRPEFYISVFIVISFLLMNVYYSVWWGGDAIGPRHLIPMLPFMTWPIIFCLEERMRIARLSFLFIAGVSVLSMFIGVASEPQAYEWIKNPLVEFFLPALYYRRIAINLSQQIFGLRGLISLLPLATPLFLGYVFLLWREMKTLKVASTIVESPLRGSKRSGEMRR